MLTLLLLLLACSGDKSTDSEPSTDSSTDELVDTDGDGVPDTADCDPNDPYAYPGAHEVPYDGIDQDCDGEDINDVDGDSYIGTGGGGDDCNDSNPNIHPGASEICYNGQDDDCDGTPELPNDCDGDGYLVGNDCNDEDPTVHPDAEDAWYDGQDTDCKGNDDYDQDGDGESWDGNGGVDCNDTDATINTDADEYWDRIDNNCDGALDQMTNRTPWASYYQSAALGDLGFGAAFEPVGDVDGDGRPDVAIGANTSGDVGRVWLLPVDEGMIHQDSEALGKIDGDAGDYLGASLLHLGDYLVVGTGDPAQGIYGYPWLFRIKDISGNILESAGTQLMLNSGGQYLVEAPDLDSDGQPELLAAAPGVTTEVDIVTYASLGGGTASWIGSAGSKMVVSAGKIGDIDGDGIQDMATEYAGDFGNFLVFLPASGIHLGETASLKDFDSLVVSEYVTHYAALPDMNGDGYEESVFSLPADQNGMGRIYLISGAPGKDFATSAFATVTGGADAQAWAEQQIDSNGDGSLELLVCSPGAESAGLQGSCATVPLADLAAGGDHVPVPGVPSFKSLAVNDLFGAGARVEDADLDGDDDLWVSMPATGAVVLFRQE